MVNEMRLEEIYVLNTALDGKNIFGLPSFSDIGGSKMMVQNVKEQMIRKGLLESESSFTMQGVKAVKYMEDYKNARKYVKLGSLVIGVKDDDTAVVLTRTGMPQEFGFQAMNLKESFAQLCMIYPFLIQKADKVVSEDKREIDYEELKETYGLTIDNAMYLSTYTVKDKETTDEIFFSADGAVCLYDRKAGVLAEPSTGIEEIIRERMA